MKKLIFRTLLIIAVYLLMSTIFRSFLPYHYGNPWLSSKISYLENHEDRHPDLFFIGSSRIHRQFVPQILDSLMKENGAGDFQSFNLGAPATFCPQTYYIYDHLLESELVNNCEYILIELINLRLKTEGNERYIERNSYWMTPREYLFSLKSTWRNPHNGLRFKEQCIRHASATLLINAFHMGQHEHLLYPTKHYKDEFVGQGKDGYLSLELEMLNTGDTVFKNHLVKRRKEFLQSGDSLLEKRALMSNQAFIHRSDTIDEVHYRRLMQMIQQAEEKGIHLVFVLSPRYAGQEEINLLYSLPEANRIDLSPAAEYPEFYSAEMSFDIGHLNTRGAALYTRILGGKLLELEKQKRNN